MNIIFRIPTTIFCALLKALLVGFDPEIIWARLNTLLPGQFYFSDRPFRLWSHNIECVSPQQVNDQSESLGVFCHHFHHFDHFIGNFS